MSRPGGARWGSEVVARGPTVVLNQLGPEAGRAIAALDPRLEVLDDAQGLPWTRAGEADILLTAPRNGWRDAPRTPPPGWPGRLQWVHTASVGVDYFAPWLFDVPQVTCARGVAAVPIAEFVMAALLAHVRPLADYCVSEPASWHSGFGRISASPPVLLAGQTLGLVGFGAIGQAVARRALAHARAGLHFINIARGGLVDHDALLAALDAGRLSGATLDVTDTFINGKNFSFKGHEYPMSRRDPRRTPRAALSSDHVMDYIPHADLMT